MSSPQPRPSATVALVRDAPGARGIEVLLLERATSNDHTSGMWVFPGGVIEERDRVAPCSHDLPEFRAAAIRECEEECGIALRSPGDLHSIGHWVTPRGRAKRFDTRFFVAVAPDGHDAVVDGGEILAHMWIAPRDALAGDFGARLMTPTRATLQALAAFTTSQQVIAWARSLEHIPRYEPWLAQSAAGLCTIPPPHPAYGELCKLDPEGRGLAWCELRPGARVKIAERVARVTDESGMNRYFVGSDEAGWEGIAPDAVRLVAEDRMVIAPDASHLTPQLRAAADWLAPERGFLVDLRR